MPASSTPSSTAPKSTHVALEAAQEIAALPPRALAVARGLMRGHLDEVIKQIETEVDAFPGSVAIRRGARRLRRVPCPQKVRPTMSLSWKDAVHHRRLARHRAGDRAARRPRRRQRGDRRQDRRPHPKLPGTIYTAAEEIERAGGKALPLVVDVRDEAMVKEAIDETAARFGGIDIVVNNASAISLTPAAATDMKRYDLMQQINTRGTFVVSKWAIPHLQKAANPHILMISPPLDMKEKWFAPHTAYTIAKFGMSLVVLGLAGELRNKGIAVNALWPRTVIATAAVNNLLGGEALMRAIAQAGDHGRRGLCGIRQAGARIHRQFSDRRYVPGRKRRHRLRALSRRPDAKAGAGLLRAGRQRAAERRHSRRLGSS